jgi:hypothetical protein
LECFWIQVNLLEARGLFIENNFVSSGRLQCFYPYMQNYQAHLFFLKINQEIRVGPFLIKQSLRCTPPNPLVKPCYCCGHRSQVYWDLEAFQKCITCSCLTELPHWSEFRGFQAPLKVKAYWILIKNWSNSCQASSSWC